MANIYEIKSRIRGVENTSKITKSMKLVSSAKLHVTQGQLKSFAAYDDNCRRALSLVLSDSRDGSRLLEEREIKHVCYVLMVGNRGLCGAYNQDVLHALEALLKKEQNDYFTVLCGQWSGDALSDEHLRVRRRFTNLSDTPRVEESDEIAQYLRQLFLDGEADKIVLVYQKHLVMGQQPESCQLLPVQCEKGAENMEWLFEPDRDTLVEKLCHMYVDACVRRCLLEARVSEHFARMTAMTSATDNADELLRGLTLTLNRTRQAKITTEISEIVGGANALGSSNAGKNGA